MTKRIEEGDLVQHMDGRQGRVAETDLYIGRLPAVKVKWFNGPEEVVVIGYVWATKMEENWE